MDFSSIKGLQRIVHSTLHDDQEQLDKMLKGGLAMLKDIFDGVHDLALWGWIGVTADPSDLFNDKNCETYLVALLKPVKGMHNDLSLSTPVLHLTNYS